MGLNIKILAQIGIIFKIPTMWTEKVFSSLKKYYDERGISLSGKKGHAITLKPDVVMVIGDTNGK